MNRKQKNLAVRFLVVVSLTLLTVVLMFDIRAWVNYSEARKAMEQLGEITTDYREKNNCVPPQSYIESVRNQIEGGARIGDFTYRGQWIEFDSPEDEILAYTRIAYPSLFADKGFIILQLNGEISWLPLKEGRQKISRLKNSPDSDARL